MSRSIHGNMRNWRVHARGIEVNPRVIANSHRIVLPSADGVDARPDAPAHRGVEMEVRRAKGA
jgi:hypothetical protein